MYLHCLCNTKLDMFCRVILIGGRTRGYSLKLEKSFSRLDVRIFSFANRVVDLWNSLPEEVVSACSVNAFKNRRDKHYIEYFIFIFHSNFLSTRDKKNLPQPMAVILQVRAYT